ncbi:type I site-specific deoxyribonuclease HsdR [Burkholderia pseudomallei]|uniref:type I restriction endonuclease subunit R n=1 Tax=Burkholderia pseudomallei TaxID=28450 RepID=UPI001E517AC0|nr:type I restriction endonuclease subunit R [Burkholderia pseudomallei]MCD4551180.1 type I restriction endonuclease subunit R [Burkholderia pseudomallei]CAJ2925176.1 type I site-specific deoxyribonuclease HsdR [Burkholderia pseudomallei]CAJ2964363.1 type I site-specific deoxyribonuclease HsdR [Burkholderia pseudomallei]CAJ3120657.1 type I site-specific deoxyribonuclease HsdR [Burkholderia pseudomallei]CAJ4369204.1 type I site-specific deoxyribonuclease HsdR [Burkholderia pseudomallei]
MTSTENQIELELIGKLSDLKYSYRPDIRDRAALEANFREKFETLNRVRLTDSEFQRLIDGIITPDVYSAAQTLRNINSFERDDGTPLNYTLVNIRDWCKNDFEVINQLRINTDNSHHRYDVMLLINGVPVVQVELKTLAVSPRRAMQQIVDYKGDPGNGYGKTLLCFIQLFIVSNRTETWYFANNNARHFSFNADERFLPVYQFASEDNKKVTQLDSFAEKFLAKCNLGQMVSRYMVLVASEQKLLMMRPYQVYAVKAIVDCIHQNCGNGYIWHTTGSGKTLTSFKASTLLKDNPDIDKCLFVVDRKDLDRQTREEFNRFQEGCVEENTNTETLVRRLLSDEYADKVIVTTIQKLGLALDGTNKKNYKERLEPLRHQRMVFIFDECHRSQFGENHKAIKEFFPKAQLFGFTGTPIFKENASSVQIEGQQASYRTTDDLFQRCLHQYTITHAIEDRNVLRFHVDYFKPDGKNPPKPGEALAKAKVIETIFAKHDAATNGRKFNAVLATASINDAIEYFEAFKSFQAKKRAEDESFQPLNIACVFSPPAEGNKDVQQIQEDLPQEKQDNQQDPEGKKAALKSIMDDYNARFGTNHRIAEFDLYYQDVQKRIKDQQYPNADLPHPQKIDITIVVDMLLTGFDSKYLNTLYADKNLKHHGLIQAFSRTNRVLNDSKPYGNILDFRQQRDSVDKAIELFSGQQTEKAREIWLVDPAPKVIDCLQMATQKLADFMQSQGLANVPEEVANLKGDAARSQFVNLFKEVQRLKTQLDQYTDLSEQQKTQITGIVPLEQLQGYKGMYLETAKRLKEQQDKQGDQAPPEVQQLDFEFVLFASAVIDYDYIIGLISRMTQQKPGKLTLNREQLIGLIQSEAKFIDEREDIADYIRGLPVGEALDEAAIRAGYERFKAEKKTRELTEIATRHGLAADALQTFVDEVLRRRIFDGEALSELMAPLGLGWKARTQKELALVEDLTPLLHKLTQGREISGLSAYE